MRTFVYLICFLVSFISVTSTNKARKKSNSFYTQNDSLSYFFDLANFAEATSNARAEATDRAFNIVKLQHKDSLQRKNLFKVANRYWNIEDRRNYFKLINSILRDSKRDKDTLHIAKCYVYLHDYFFDRSEYDSAFYYIIKSERLYRKLMHNDMLAHVLLSKALLHFTHDNYYACEKILYDIINIPQITPDDRFSSFMLLANLYTFLREFDLAKKYYNIAQDTIKTIPNDQYWNYATLYNDMGYMYLNSEKYIEAENILTKALNIKNVKRCYPRLYSIILSNLSYAKLERGSLTDPSMIYEALKIQDSAEYKYEYPTTKVALAKYFLSRKDTVRGISIAQEAYKYALVQKLSNKNLVPLRELIHMNPPAAKHYMTLYLTYSDSLRSLERRNWYKFARIEYETDELEKQIEKVESEKASLSQVGIILMFVLLTVAVFWWQHVRTKELGFIREKSEQNSQIFELLNNDHQKIQQGKNIEKKRIARELHDGVMGRLTSIRLNLFALKKDTGQGTIEKCIAHIDSIQEIEKEIRSIAYDLGSDIMSDEVSFISIIKSLFASIEEHSEIQLHFDASDDIPWSAISNNTKMQTYRIIQESLHNIEKHAQAKNVWLLVTSSQKSIEFTIRDDGVGFCKKKIKKGFGLANIYGRARTIKAHVVIDSAANIGTTIKLTVPFENNTPKTNEDDNKNPSDRRSPTAD